MSELMSEATRLKLLWKSSASHVKGKKIYKTTFEALLDDARQMVPGRPIRLADAHSETIDESSFGKLEHNSEVHIHLEEEPPPAAKEVATQEEVAAAEAPIVTFQPLTDDSAWWWLMRLHYLPRIRSLRPCAGDKRDASLVQELWDASPRTSLLLLGADLLSQLAGRDTAGECVRLLLLYESEDSLLHDLHKSLAQQDLADVIVLTTTPDKHAAAMSLEDKSARLLCVRHAQLEAARSTQLLFNKGTFEAATRLPRHAMAPPLGTDGPPLLLLCTTFSALPAGKTDSEARKGARKAPDRASGLLEAFRPPNSCRPFDACLHQAASPPAGLTESLASLQIRCAIVHSEGPLESAGSSTQSAESTQAGKPARGGGAGCKKRRREMTDEEKDAARLARLARREKEERSAIAIQRGMRSQLFFRLPYSHGSDTYLNALDRLALEWRRHAMGVGDEERDEEVWSKWEGDVSAMAVEVRPSGVPRKPQCVSAVLEQIRSADRQRDFLRHLFRAEVSVRSEPVAYKDVLEFVLEKWEQALRAIGILKWIVGDAEPWDMERLSKAIPLDELDEQVFLFEKKRVQ